MKFLPMLTVIKNADPTPAMRWRTTAAGRMAIATRADARERRTIGANIAQGMPQIR